MTTENSNDNLRVHPSPRYAYAYGAIFLALLAAILLLAGHLTFFAYLWKAFVALGLIGQD